MDKAADGANVRFPPPLIYVAGLALGVAADRVLNVPSLGLSLATRIVAGLVLDVAGFLVMFAGAGLFLRRRTAILPFKPASALVTSGILGWTRNPMYLGMAVFYIGLAVILNSLVALVVLPLVLAIVQTQVIAREEAYLERAFGNEYVAYRTRVRRWL
ncbi:MAG TPA: isoprenylcysteine carboxylmethyltransferase family protein [Sphingomicrobium sp.]|nr:isoprenylcysteine carboxylmethyltransferase family protein [Sphingomicrobium sp.]